MNIWLFITSVFLVTSCGKKSETIQEELKIKTKSKEVITLDTTAFIPDISVNGLFLDDNVTIESQVGDLMPLLNQSEDFPSFFIFNIDTSKYLKLIFFSGHVKNRFHSFEVGYLSENLDKRHSAVLKAQDFVTESGVKLKMSKQDIIKIKGKEFFDEGGNKIKYVIDDFGKSTFLRKYNMPLYFSLYEFDKNNILIKYSFGFEYP